MERVIDHYTQALAISREIGGRRGEGVRLGNLRIAYFSLGEVGRAIAYAEAALEIFEQIKNPGAAIVRKWLS